MGRLNYNGQVAVDIDDRALAHLQIVIADKLRRGEPFTFSWRDDPSTGHGRTTIWISQSSSLVFTFHGSRMPRINRDWLEVLAVAANAVGGLRVVAEPASGLSVEPSAHHEQPITVE